MKINLRLKSIDATRPLKATEEAVQYALWATAEDIQQEIRPYVPHQHGALQGSARIYQRKSSADIVWGGTGDVDYAEIRYNWPGVSKPNAKAPNASSQWDQVALRDHGDQWRQMFNNAVKRRMS